MTGQNEKMKTKRNDDIEVRSVDEGSPSNGQVANGVAKVTIDTSDSPQSSPDHHNDISTFIQDDKEMQEVAREKHIVEKLVYTISVLTLLLLAYSVLSYHWLLPYYYTISMPALMILRLVVYWKLKYQFFMLDFCYFGNALCFLYMWASPGHPEVFAVMYGLANGPMAWAVVLFRNSMVLHDYDRMTSIYIHVLPLFIMYSARWYPSSISEYWYTQFTDSFNEDIGYMFIWLVAVPFACFIFHALLYILLVYFICRPGPDYLYSFNYLSAKENAGCTGRSISCCGKVKSKIGKLISYSLFNVLYGTLSLLVLPLWYKYFIANTLYIAAITAIITWNGASFYLDVFAKKGHVQA